MGVWRKRNRSYPSRRRGMAVWRKPPGIDNHHPAVVKDYPQPNTDNCHQLGTNRFHPEFLLPSGYLYYKLFLLKVKASFLLVRFLFAIIRLTTKYPPANAWHWRAGKTIQKYKKRFCRVKICKDLRITLIYFWI